jgi:hypothetical protein
LGVAKRSLSFGTGGDANSDGLNFQLAEDIKKELEELNLKGIDVNEFLRKALKQRKEEIEEKKEKIAQEILSSQEKVSTSMPEGSTIEGSLSERNDARESTKNRKAIDQGKKSTSPVNQTGANPSRYIPAKVKKIIKEEFGTKCSITNCKKQAEVLHHTQKFGLAHCHDPRFLAPLCKDHHTIAHSIDVKFNEIKCYGSAHTSSYTVLSSKSSAVNPSQIRVTNSPTPPL